MSGHWFEPVADHLGEAYLRYSFTRGTEQEVDALVRLLDLAPGARVLDVGCGPGRHALALGERGYEVVGVDISQRFVDLGNARAPGNVRFERADARALGFDAEFDAVISICQGAFGLSGGPASPGEVRSVDPDAAVLAGMARALRPGGRMWLTAFNAYFQVRYLEETDDFDADAGVNRETTTVRSEAGEDMACELWTTCFTPRELRLLVAAVGLQLDHVWSVRPGAYGPGPPTVDLPELAVVATRP